MIRLLILILFFCANLASALEKLPPRKFCGGQVAPTQESHAANRSLDNLYQSADVPKAIPDGPGGVAVSVLDITDDIQITDLNVILTIEHTWIRDLKIMLLSPFDSTALLLDLYPGDFAVNMTGTTFDDEAAHSINDTAFSRPPFIGVYRPLQTLARMENHSAQGQWTLRVEDRFAVDTGTIVSWAIDVNPIPSLTGTVRNSVTNLPVTTATVEVMGANRIAQTNASGVYSVSGLADGTYALKFYAQYYDTLIIDNVNIAAGQTTTQDALMIPSVLFVDFASTSRAVDIPDGGADSMLLSVPDNYRILDLNVTVNITHSYVGDLGLKLRSPGGAMIELVHVGENCLALGENLTNTIFDDQAAQAFTNGTGPFTGTWRPFGTLATFNAQNTIGPWYLRVEDFCVGDEGTIDGFVLHVASALDAENSRGEIPDGFAFEGNYPNPFNSSTEFRFTLPVQSKVSLKLFNLLGQEAAQITNDIFMAGEHKILFDGKALTSGLYFAQFQAGNFSETKKIILLK